MNLKENRKAIKKLKSLKSILERHMVYFDISDVVGGGDTANMISGFTIDIDIEIKGLEKAIKDYKSGAMI